MESVTQHKYQDMNILCDIGVEMFRLSSNIISKAGPA